jgi:hypothetical protein
MFMYECSWPHIKREFWSQRAANAAIKSALESGCVVDFRSKILTCASDVAKKKGSDKASSRHAEKVRARKEQQQHASLHSLDLKQGDESATHCDNPVCNVSLNGASCVFALVTRRNAVPRSVKSFTGTRITNTFCLLPKKSRKMQEPVQQQQQQQQQQQPPQRQQQEKV